MKKRVFSQINLFSQRIILVLLSILTHADNNFRPDIPQGSKIAQKKNIIPTAIYNRYWNSYNIYYIHNLCACTQIRVWQINNIYTFRSIVIIIINIKQNHELYTRTRGHTLRSNGSMNNNYNNPSENMNLQNNTYFTEVRISQKNLL